METLANVLVGIAGISASLMGLGIWLELRRVRRLADRNERRLSGRAED